MKRIVPFTLLSLTLLSCGTEPPTDQAISQSIEAYISKHAYNMTPTESGVYVEVLAPGNGQAIRYNDKIRVVYRGEFLSGEAFDEPKDTITFRLKNLIPAWKEVLIGLPEGTHLRLITPPSMGYGDQDNGVIPPHSTLFFDIEVVEAF